MTIQLLTSISVAGVHQPIGQQLTLGAASEAELVNRGVANWVFGNPSLRPVLNSVTVPSGVHWLTDQTHGFDIYKKGFDRRPTLFFDPNNTGSAGIGTYKNPYSTQAQLEAAIKGNMAGHVLGFKRGSTLIATGSGGLNLKVYGTNAEPFIICPYGDADALPIISAHSVPTWTLVDAATNIWSYALGATQYDVWQRHVRLTNKTWATSAVNTLTTEGTATYNASVLYIRPYNSENPNLGQVFVPVGEYAFLLQYSDVAASGYVEAAGLDIRYARRTACLVAAESIPNITSAAGIKMMGCTFSHAGLDATVGTSSVACAMYGPSDAIRLTGSVFAGNYSTDVLNNAFECSGMSGLLIEHNRSYDCGGNSIVELWSSNDNVTIRYNRGELSSALGRISQAPAQCGIWFANYYNLAGNWDTNDTTNTKNFNNKAYFNLIINPKVRGMKASGGTGHIYVHNTHFFDADVTTPGTTGAPQGWYTEGTAATGFLTLSNNVFYWKNTVQATRNPNHGYIATTVSANASIPSGDKNLYCSQDGYAGGNWVVTGAGTSGNFVTYKGYVATYALDQNSFAVSDLIPSGNITLAAIGFSELNYTPLAAGLAGITTLTSIGNRYQSGQPYIPGSATAGAFKGY